MLALEATQRERLLALTSPVSLDSKEILFGPGERIDTVYFPETAVVSLLTTVERNTPIEVVSIGNEGIVGVPVFLGVEHLGARECYQVEIAGQARALDTVSFLEAAQRDPLRGLVQRFVHALFIQVAQRLACVALHSIPRGVAVGSC